MYNELNSVLLTKEKKAYLCYQQRDPLCPDTLAGCHSPLGNRAQEGLQVGLTAQAWDIDSHLKEGNCSTLESTHMSLLRVRDLVAITPTNLLQERQVVLPKWLNQHSMKICVSVLMPGEFPLSKISNFCDLW